MFSSQVGKVPYLCLATAARGRGGAEAIGQHRRLCVLYACTVQIRRRSQPIHEYLVHTSGNE